MSKANDMKLPEGRMCRDCLNYRPCANLFKCKKDNTTCDWSPSRFDEIPITPEKKLKQAEEALAKSEEGVAAQSERIISLENDVRTKEEALKVAREALKKIRKVLENRGILTAQRAEILAGDAINKINSIINPLKDKP